MRIEKEEDDDDISSTQGFTPCPSGLVNPATTLDWISHSFLVGKSPLIFWSYFIQACFYYGSFNGVSVLKGGLLCSVVCEGMSRQKNILADTHTLT